MQNATVLLENVTDITKYVILLGWGGVICVGWAIWVIFDFY